MSAEQEDKVPVFGKWNRWYWFVVVLLVLQIILFYLFTKHFA